MNTATETEHFEVKSSVTSSFVFHTQVADHHQLLLTVAYSFQREQLYR